MRNKHYFQRFLLAVTIMGSFLFFATGQSAVLGKTLVFNASGGMINTSLKIAFLNDYEKIANIKVLLTSPCNFAKLKAMVESKNVEWDIIELTPRNKLQAVSLGLLEKLNYTNINTDELYPGTYDDYGVGFSFYSTILGYNLKRYTGGKPHPTTWAEFWDVKKFPGARSIRNSPVDNLEMALLADGVPPEKVYPIDLERAFRKLDEIKPHIDVWWKVGAQPAQLLMDGEVDLATGWNGRFSDVQRKGAAVGQEWNQGILKMTWLAIPKGTKNYKEASKLMDYMMRSENQFKWNMTSDYTGPSKTAFELMKDPEKLKFLPTSPQNFEKQIVQDDKWWGENVNKVQDMWDAWILK